MTVSRALRFAAVVFALLAWLVAIGTITADGTFWRPVALVAFALLFSFAADAA